MANHVVPSHHLANEKMLKIISHQGDAQRSTAYEATGNSKRWRG